MADKVSTYNGVAERWQEVRPGEYARTGYAEDAVSAAAGLGRLFMGSCPRTTVTSTTLRAGLTNPAGSGRRLVLLQLAAALEEDAMAYTAVRLNPTTGAPTGTLATKFNTALGHPDPGVADIRIDTGAAPAGGTFLGTVPIPGGNRVRDLTLPGLVLSATAASLATINTSLSLVWWEQDLTDS